MFAGVDLVNTIYEEYELSDIVLDDFIEHYKLESEVVQFLDADAIVNKFIKRYLVYTYDEAIEKTK